MTRRSRIWWLVALLFTLINFAGGLWATLRGEVPHAWTHVVLTLAGAFVMWWIAARARRLEPMGMTAETERLETLQQSIDAVAIEVERIGEAQRFGAKLQADRTERVP